MTAIPIIIDLGSICSVGRNYPKGIASGVLVPLKTPLRSPNHFTLFANCRSRGQIPASEKKTHLRTLNI